MVSFSHWQTSYKLRSSTRQACLLCSWYIHLSCYHTCSTALTQRLIQEYDNQISHLYHPVTGSKKTYDSLRTQDPVKLETSFSKNIGQLAQVVGAHMKDVKENIFFITRHQVPTG